MNHQGVLNKGHYRACARTKGGNWALYDDEAVQPIDSQSIVTAGAYVLFYQRRETAKETQTHAADLQTDAIEIS